MGLASPGRSATRRFAFENRDHEVFAALDRIEAALLEEGVASEMAGELRLVVEEGVTNIAAHAYPGGEAGAIEVTISVAEADVRLVLRDRGRPFDPLAAPPPDFESPLAERRLGGLGIHLIRSLTDEQSYSRESEENVLVLVKRRGAA